MTNLIKFSGVQANDTQSVSRNTFPIIVLPIYGVDRNYFVNIVFQMHPIR